MFDTLRKVMYLGMGAAAMSWDKIRSTIDDLVERGELSAEEGKKLFSELTSRAEEEGRALNERIRAQVRSMLKDLGVADRAEISALEARIETLERRIEELSAAYTAPETVEG